MNISSLKRATYSAFTTSVVFWFLFQLSKIRGIQNAAPFADDPYDAVASFAFQIAMAIALLSLARLVSIKDERGQRQRAPFILRGVLLVEICVFVTLISNLVAIVKALPLTLSTPMIYTFEGMALLTTFFSITGIFWINARKETGNISAEASPDALGQTINDCWTLIAVISAHIVTRMPVLRPLWSWADSAAHATANGWNKRLSFANPNQHPWGFAMTFAVLVGLLFMGATILSESLSEGGPPNPTIALLLAGIFFAGETIAILLSFLFFGGYLGLRPRK